MLRPWVREDLRASVDEVNRLTERYTMHLERGVHRRLLGNGAEARSAETDGTPKTETPPGEKRSQGTDELGDNVELF
jgi:hypothetical protein